MSKSRLNYQCTFNLDKCIKALGLEEKGKIQQFVTNEFMKNVPPLYFISLSTKVQFASQYCYKAIQDHMKRTGWYYPAGKTGNSMQPYILTNTNIALSNLSVFPE